LDQAARSLPPVLSRSLEAGPGHPPFVTAVNELLRVITDGGRPADALQRSLRGAAAGLAADKALAFVAEQVRPLRLRATFAQGLTHAQVHACERGVRVEGVDLDLIRTVVEARRPRVEAGTLCAPVLDHARDAVVAVMYFERGPSPAEGGFGARDAVWVEAYASALGPVFERYLHDGRRAHPLGAAAAVDAPALVGTSAYMEALRVHLHDTCIPAVGAPDPDPLLIVGEKGTGKDLLARYIHAHSARRARPFVPVNCAEISDELATARFFGHRKGSFTGAIADQPGFFRAAAGGVLFLDEIGELSLRAQATLLRVLENRTVVPIGETRETRVDVAVLLATNRDLDRAVEEGTLKVDLLDRFRTHFVRLEPLRDRADDIRDLATHFLAVHERRTGKQTRGFTAESLADLAARSWPGNVRELARLCSLLVAHVRDGDPIDLPLVARCCPDVARPACETPAAIAEESEDQPLRNAVRAFTRNLLVSRLARHGWNIGAARRSLELPKTTFHRYMTALGIRPPSAGREEEEA
jgi:two-component system response regulator AtoC